MTDSDPFANQIYKVCPEVNFAQIALTHPEPEEEDGMRSIFVGSSGSRTLRGVFDTGCAPGGCATTGLSLVLPACHPVSVVG
jgi:hypothetical protein